MDTLTNKRYQQYDYTSRYTDVPYYYDIINGRDVYGIGSNLSKTTSWVGHEVKPTDTLDTLALKYYNNATFWWIIAFFNDIQDPFIQLSDRFEVIKIPAISSIEFGNERK
jgi:hypothetical protein